MACTDFRMSETISPITVYSSKLLFVCLYLDLLGIGHFFLEFLLPEVLHFAKVFPSLPMASCKNFSYRYTIEHLKQASLARAFLQTTLSFINS